MFSIELAEILWGLPWGIPSIFGERDPWPVDTWTQEDSVVLAGVRLDAWSEFDVTVKFSEALDA